MPGLPDVELEPFTLSELHERIRGGEEESDCCELMLVCAGQGRAELKVQDPRRGHRRGPEGLRWYVKGNRFNGQPPAAAP